MIKINHSTTKLFFSSVGIYYFLLMPFLSLRFCQTSGVVTVPSSSYKPAVTCGVTNGGWWCEKCHLIWYDLPEMVMWHIYERNNWTKTPSLTLKMPQDFAGPHLALWGTSSGDQTVIRYYGSQQDVKEDMSWWRHQMEIYSVLLAICVGNSPVTGEFPAQRPVTRSCVDLFDLRLSQRLSKQW